MEVAVPQRGIWGTASLTTPFARGGLNVDGAIDSSIERLTVPAESVDDVLAPSLAVSARGGGGGSRGVRSDDGGLGSGLGSGPGSLLGGRMDVMLDVVQRAAAIVSGGSALAKGGARGGGGAGGDAGGASHQANGTGPKTRVAALAERPPLVPNSLEGTLAAMSHRF